MTPTAERGRGPGAAPNAGSSRAPDYPAEVRARLEADAEEVIARYPDSRSALLPLLHLVQSEEGHVTRTGHRVLRRGARASPRAEVTAVATFYSMYRRKPYRRLPGRGLHQHPVRGDGRRRDLRGAAAASGRRQRRDHRGRQDHPRAHRVQRGLRLRPRGDGQLGVLRQPDPRSPADRRRPAGGPHRRARPAARRCAPSGRPPASSPASPTRARAPSRRAAAPDPPRWSGCGWPRARPRPAGSSAEVTRTYRVRTREAPPTHPSSHDAPQRTAASDPHHPAGPVTEEGGVMTADSERDESRAPRSCWHPCCRRSGTSPSPGRWTPTAPRGLRGHAQGARHGARRCDRAASRTRVCAAAAARASPPA